MQDHIGLRSGLFQLFFCLECMPLNCFRDIFFIRKTDFVPSLTSLAAEEVVKADSFRSDQLPLTLQHFVLDSTETPDIQFDGETFQERLVLSWRETEKPEIPQPQEIQGFNDGEIERVSSLSSEDLSRLYDHLEDLESRPSCEVRGPQGGIKLGGYVRWCQGVEYPVCPSCQAVMSLTFLQLEEDDLHPFSWGDAGTGHVTLCPHCRHPAISWACC